MIQNNVAKLSNHIMLCRPTITGVTETTKLTLTQLSFYKFLLECNLRTESCYLWPWGPQNHKLIAAVDRIHLISVHNNMWQVWNTEQNSVRFIQSLAFNKSLHCIFKINRILLQCTLYCQYLKTFY